MNTYVNSGICYKGKVGLTEPKSNEAAESEERWETDNNIIQVLSSPLSVSLCLFPELSTHLTWFIRKRKTATKVPTDSTSLRNYVFLLLNQCFQKSLFSHDQETGVTAWISCYWNHFYNHRDERKHTTDGHYKREWNAVYNKGNRRHHVKLKMLNINLNQTLVKVVRRNMKVFQRKWFYCM